MAPRDDQTSVLDSLRRLVRFLRVATRRAEQQAGASAAQLFVLSELAVSPAPSLAELAARTMTDASSVSTVVARLVKAGYVVRRRARSDRRRSELALSRRGRAVVAAAPELAQTRINAAVAAMTPAQRRALVASLRRLVAGIGADQEPARMFFEDEPARRRPRVRAGTARA